MDYRNFSFRLFDSGLGLRNVNDTVKEGNWVRLSNTRSTQEGLIQTREGQVVDVDTGGADTVHTVKRLTSSTKLIGVRSSLYRNGTIFSEGGFSGDPLDIAVSRPALGSSVWGYIGNSSKMRKVKEDGTIYKWGITPPSNQANFVAFGSGNLNSSAAGATTYDWRYTYYSSATGAESNPSPTNVAGGIAAVSQRANVQVTASTDAQVDQIRIYRRGGTLTTYRLVMTVANSSIAYEDNVADSTIATASVMRTDRDVPFTSVDSTGLTVREVAVYHTWGPFQGKYIFACGDPYRKGHLYWTNAERPDEAASTNNVEVSSLLDPLQNGFIYSANPFVFSKNELWAIQFGQSSAGATFTGQKTPCGRGLVQPWAFCVGPMIWFLSNDGIYETNGYSPAISITEETIRPIFNGLSASNFTPVDLTLPRRTRLAYSGQEVHFLYQDTSGVSQHLIYHTLYKRWRSASYPWITRVVYNDEDATSKKLYLGDSLGVVYTPSLSSTTDNGTAISVSARTGSLDLGAPNTRKKFGNLVVDADPQGGTITVTPLYGAETTTGAALTMTGTGRTKYALSLSDTLAYSLALDFSWSGAGTIYSLDVLWQPDEEPLRNWDTQPTTHGLTGWQMIRDLYITLRSNASVTLRLRVDGKDNSYPIASTGNAKRKLYVPLDPLRGKVFRYSLSSSADFFLYGPECEVRVKPWNTSLSYQTVSPFA